MLRFRSISVMLTVGALFAPLLVPLPAYAVVASSSAASDAVADRTEVRTKKAEVASQVDTMVADSSEIDAALADIKANVKGQEALAVNAQQAWEDADRRATEAEQRAAERAGEVATLAGQLTTVAVNSYVSPPGQDLLDRFKAGTATEYARKQALLGVQANRTGDVIDQLRSAKYNLEREKNTAEQARADALRGRDAALVQIDELKAAQSQQEDFAAGLRERLNAKLAEAASLESFDKELAAQVRAEQDTLVAQIQSLPAPPQAPIAGDGSTPPPTPDPVSPSPVTPAPIPPGPVTPAPSIPAPSIPVPTPPTTAPPSVPVPAVPRPPTTWVRGIEVASSIASQTDGLLAAAAAAGLPLSGGGYRNADQQIALRRQNCGTSNWAIYYMDASQCSPPTAIPGSSNHERGLAIDFAQSSTRNTPRFQWLAANAARFGFCNLPSEPWHWSTNCR